DRDRAAAADRRGLRVSGPLLGPDALLEPLRAALRGAPGDGAELWAHRRRAAITRYARSQIHQNALCDEIHVRARVAIGAAFGSVTTNGLDGDSLKRALADAAELARHLPPDPEWSGLADAQPVSDPISY